MADGPVRGRGRARSRTLEGDDLIAEVAAATGAPAPAPASPGGAGSASSSPAAKTVSKRTQKALKEGLETSTGPALAKPSPFETTPDEEEQMEKELRELERMEALKRVAAPAAATGSASASSGVRSIRAGKDGADGAPAYDLLIKLLMLGDSGVGKTTLLKRYAEGRFDSMIAATAGVAYETQYVEVEGRTIRVDIWDTAGQERFHVITQAYYAGANGIVLAYDASEEGETSFNNVRYWMDAIGKHASPNCVKVLLGNKVDKTPKVVPRERGKAVADEYGVSFFETSAKSGSNVTEAFHCVARQCVLKALRAEGVTVSAGAAADASAAASASAGKKRCAVM